MKAAITDVQLGKSLADTLQETTEFASKIDEQKKRYAPKLSKLVLSRFPDQIPRLSLLCVRFCDFYTIARVPNSWFLW